MYFFYLLQSLKDHRTYAGFTSDVTRRLKEHHSGRVASTKKRTPFKILFTEEFDTALEAKNRELWWKSSSGRRELKKYFEASQDQRPNPLG